jgi:predicted amidohydrolase YtcJ
MALADLIVINGDILTMDALYPRVEALAVSGGRVVALGTTDDIRSYAGPDTKVIDAGGRMVLPGFQDTHIHLQDSGHGYGLNANLETARDIAELQKSLKEFAAAPQGCLGEWCGLVHRHLHRS